MTYNLINLMPIMPEIFILCASCLVLVIDLFLKKENFLVTYFLSLATLACTIVIIIYSDSVETKIIFDGSFIRDSMSDLLKISLLVATCFVMVYAKDYLVQHDIFRGEYYTLTLFGALGMMIMSSAYSFLTVYLGLELLALSMYALVAFDRDSKKGSEAAMKYFVLGAIASGMLLYGISMLYGATGELSFSEVAKAISIQDRNDMVLIFGLVFIVIGIAFKFGAVPFHMWVPDVYHGAPTAVTLLLGSAPKIAAFALAIRLLVDGMQGLSQHWQDMLIILTLLSLAIGNIIAIAQENLKRMLAYSTIAHVGFIFLGIAAANDKGYGAALFYTIVYAVTAAGGFGVLAMLSRKGFKAEKLTDLCGLNDRSPWMAAMMGLILFSMAGVPPTVGFFSKLFVLESIISIDMVWLASAAVFFSIIGAYYYLRAIKMMYFDKPIDNAKFEISIDSNVALSINGLSLLGFGLFPAALFNACRAAFGS
mgnify:CR=1 FL=1